MASFETISHIPHKELGPGKKSLPAGMSKKLLSQEQKEERMSVRQCTFIKLIQNQG
jgi:hypothetical protein